MAQPGSMTKGSALPNSNRSALDAWLEESGHVLAQDPEPRPLDPELIKELARRPWARMQIDREIEVIIARGHLLDDEFVVLISQEIQTGQYLGAVLIPSRRFSSFRSHLGNLDHFLRGS